MNIQKKSVEKSVANINTDSFSNSINSIRAIAVIIIIFSHSSSLTFSLDLGGHLYYSMGALGVAIFTFLSGMLLTRTKVIKQGLNQSWMEWFKRRVIRIYPLLILSTIFVLLYKFLLFAEIFDLNSILIHMSGFQAIPTNQNSLLIMAPHWFITFILSCYLIFPLLYSFLKKEFKLTLVIGILIYFIFFIFNEKFYGGIEYFFSEILHKGFKINFFTGYFPGYFTFFFGMILGYILGEDATSKRKLFNNKKNKLWIFSLLLILCLLSLILGGIYGITLFTRYKFLYTIVLFPSITISLIIFLIIYLDDKNKINNWLKIPGNHSYEIFLIHLFPISMLTLLEFDLELYFIYLLIVIISNIILSHPFYYIGNWIKNKRRYHDTIITISLSLMIYAVIIYVLQLETALNNLYALILFFSISIIMGSIMILKKFFRINITQQV